MQKGDYLRGDRRLKAINGMVVYDVEKNMLVKLNALEP
jgi:hypothetical protein